jgi:hypothetical protein
MRAVLCGAYRGDVPVRVRRRILRQADHAGASPLLNSRPALSRRPVLSTQQRAEISDCGISLREKPPHKGLGSSCLAAVEGEEGRCPGCCDVLAVQAPASRLGRVWRDVAACGDLALHVQNERLVDTHEHMCPEAEWVGEGPDVLESLFPRRYAGFDSDTPFSARCWLTRTLAGEVEDDDLTEAEAMRLATRLMRENQYACFDVEGRRSAIVERSLRDGL